MYKMGEQIQAAAPLVETVSSSLPNKRPEVGNTRSTDSAMTKAESNVMLDTNLPASRPHHSRSKSITNRRASKTGG
ncbi:hypothetical protein JOL62DRAFT_616803 [Phyllosticta paracitricarpa]|uniref:Uncharacterized protein n=1 Tax=Phyllosticta paracitricarpa TaxID=2016321 RepID=A0ABR1MS26_9PEZI